MKMIKWGALFIGSFCLAFVIFATFSQEPFKQTAPAVIFTYQTPPVRLYWYVVGALALGLAAGLAVALYYYIALRARLGKNEKYLAELERRTAEMGSAPDASGDGPEGGNDGKENSSQEPLQ
jgi:hypothetical protein